MSTGQNNKLENQEVDLSIISKKIANFFQNINTSIFTAIQFVIKNIIIIGILFAIGVGIGVYLDQTRKSYSHQIIVQPNFGSTDYLYAKIELIDSKIKDNDTIFLKSIGLPTEEIFKVEIKPVIDIYRFINNSDQNFELLKLMSEDSDIKKIMEEKATSKNYAFHMITFVTKTKTTSKRVVEPLLNYLNNNVYYSKLQKVYIENELLKMKANELTIAQIDGFLNSFSNTANSTSRSDKLVYYNENTQLNDVILTKDRLTKEQGVLRLDLVGLDKIIKDNSNTLNIENTESMNGKLKLLLPMLLIFGYVCLHYFISFYRKQTMKSKI
jgi:hypothetical protein